MTAYVVRISQFSLSRSERGLLTNSNKKQNSAMLCRDVEQTVLALNICEARAAFTRAQVLRITICYIILIFFRRERCALHNN